MLTLPHRSRVPLPGRTDLPPAPPDGRAPREINAARCATMLRRGFAHLYVDVMNSSVYLTSGESTVKLSMRGILLSPARAQAPRKPHAAAIRVCALPGCQLSGPTLAPPADPLFLSAAAAAAGTARLRPQDGAAAAVDDQRGATTSRSTDPATDSATDVGCCRLTTSSFLASTIKIEQHHPRFRRLDDFTTVQPAYADPQQAILL